MAAAVPRYSDWLSEDQVRELSEAQHDPPELAARRQDAFRAFQELALEPNPLYRKYGYFAGVDLTGIEPVGLGQPVASPPPQPHTVQIVHDASGTRITLPPDVADAGVRVIPFSQAALPAEGGVDGFLRGSVRPSDRLSALATTLLNRGYRLELPKGMTTPVRVKDVTVLSEPHEALSVRRAVRVGAGARLLFSEEVYSLGGVPPGQRFYGSSTDLDLGDEAHAAYLTLHAPDAQAIAVYGRTATVQRNGRLGWVWAGFGGYRTKARNRSQLLGAGSDLEDLQTFYGAQQQAYDSAVDITHVATDTHGQSITRGVFKDEARGMSRGLVRIEKDARRTLSFLSEHAMLLNRGARSDTIPILEILCRDVKATHSSSVAPVDPERVFYLESRGISPSDAVRMIGEGFLSHVLEKAPFTGLREALYPYLAARWDGHAVDWGDGRTASLPPLEFRSASAETEWRFDAKLRS